jgi:very-short-patch-repair endonuclease
MQLDDELHRLAAAQDGLLSTHQLRSGGIPAWKQRRFVATGWIRRVAPRVYALRGAPDTHRQRLRAGLLSLGERSWISFEAAAALHGLDRSDGRRVEFTIDRGRRPTTAPFIVHTSKRLPAVDTVEIDGLRVTSATRTVFDLALARAHPRRLEAAIDSAVHRQLSSPEVLARRLVGLRGSGRWGCRTVESLIDASGVESVLERRFLELVRRSGLPEPRMQVVFHAETTFVARVDFLFDEFDLVVEVTGKKGHSTPLDRQRDAQRRNELQDLGLRVIEYTYDDVIDRPRWVINSLRSRLRPAA